VSALLFCVVLFIAGTLASYFSAKWKKNSRGRSCSDLQELLILLALNDDPWIPFFQFGHQRVNVRCIYQQNLKAAHFIDTQLDFS